MANFHHRIHYRSFGKIFDQVPEKERYGYLNADFQRITRRDKKAFLSDQCKEIEENNRIGKTRDLFQKNQRYQGNISCKDGLNKGQKWYGPNRSRRY